MNCTTEHSTYRIIRRRLSTLLKYGICLMSVLFVSSCNPGFEEFNDPMARELTIKLNVPGGNLITRASEQVSSIEPESRIYRAQIWMFNHQAPDDATRDNEIAVSYIDVDLGEGWVNTTDRVSGYYDEWTNETTYEIRMTIPGYVMGREDSKMKFDFYVLANGGTVRNSSGDIADRNSTRGQIKNLTFGTAQQGDPFGTTSPVVDIAGKGLPITGFFNKIKDKSSDATEPYLGGDDGVDLSFLKTNPTFSGNELKKLMPVIQLRRAVAKVKFAFAMSNGMTGVQISKIVIDDQIIPDYTYLFPREDGTDFLLPGTTEQPLTYGGEVTIQGASGQPLFDAAGIQEVSDPELLKRGSDQKIDADQAKAPNAMTAQEYDTFLASHTTSKTVYLRESDKPVTGTIFYRMPGMADSAPDMEATFTMDGTGLDFPNTTNLHRNHYWTVYAYFRGGALYIKPVVLPWVDGGSYDFTTPGTAFVSYSNNPLALFGYGWTTSTENSWYTAGKPTEWYFRRNDPGNTDWDNDWVHSQMVVAPGLNLANAPIFANRIELTTIDFSEPLILKLSDPEHFELVIYHSNSADYEVVNDPDGAVIPEEVAANGITYFYVVPKDGAANLNLTVSAYLVTAETGLMIPFNANAFPGSIENTGIYFYSVSQDTFKGYYNTPLPENVKAYDKDGEITL